jgi:hypothetical protein
MSVFHNVPGVPRKKMERFHPAPGAKAPQMRDFFMHLIQNRTLQCPLPLQRTHFYSLYFFINQ